MTKDEFGDLLAEIGGGPEIGIVSRRERDAAENSTLSRHGNEIWALLCLGDALHQFYRDTLYLVGETVSSPQLTPTQTAMANWHLVCFNRFAAAFDLMAHGYYFEAMMLGRDLWEVSLSLAGLQRNVVTLEEVLASKATTRKEAEKHSRKVDQTIRRVLIRENALLSTSAREAVEIFLGIANVATHKSKLHLALNLHRITKQQAIPLYPHFDLERATSAHNVLGMSTWSLISTLPYLTFALPPAEIGWHSMYGKVQIAFREGLARGPNPVLQAWPEVIRHVFGT